MKIEDIIETTIHFVTTDERQKEHETSDNNETKALHIADVSGSFSWTTDYYHNDNAFTMTDFLENHLPDGVEIYLEDGSYAEVRVDNTNYALDAKGNGDSYNHIVEWNVV